MVDVSQALSLDLSLEATVEARFLDAMSHMNVAWYMHLFDRAMWQFFERHGLDAESLRSAQRGMFGLEENLRYLSELREGDAVAVRTGVLEVRAKTLRFVQYMVDESKQQVAAAREVVATHIDLTTRRSAPFEAAVSARLRAAPQATAPDGAMSEAAAQQFARAWVDAWNRRDVEAVLAHYADHAVFISPKAARFVGSARLEGKAALRAYWQTGLTHIKRIEFTLDQAFWSARAQTLTVVYQCILQDDPPTRAVEIMRFEAGSVVHGEALYGGVFAAAAGA